jgi:peptide/nickel transport system substrate-binding protein
MFGDVSLKNERSWIRFRGLSNVILLVLLGVLTAGASLAAAAVGGDRAQLDSVVIREAQDYTSMNILTIIRPVNYAVSSPGYDRLISLDRDANGYVPYLATSWKLTPRSVVFTLRKDAKCADGHMLNAIDVLNSFRAWIQLPKAGGTVASSPIGGWGPGPYHLHANVKASTLSLSLEAPYRNLLAPFAQLGVICPAGLTALQGDPRALDNAVYGSGPYTLVSAKHADQVVWHLRPDWHWGPRGTSAKTMAQTVTYRYVPDDTTAANLLLTSGLDISDISGPDIGRLDGNSSLTHKRQKNYYTQSIVFNMRPGRIFADDDKLREAVMTAVDRQKWNIASLESRGIPATSVFRHDAECYDPKTAKLIPKPDLAAARQLVQADGYTYSGGKALKNGQQARVVVNGSNLMNSGPDYVAQVLQDLGFDVVLQKLDQGPYGNNMLNGNFDVGIVNGSRIVPDAGENLTALQGPPSPSGINLASTGGGDPVYQRYVNAGFQNPGAGGCKYFALVQERILQKHYALPLAEWYYEVFGRSSLDFPPFSTTLSSMPVFYIKAK